MYRSLHTYSQTLTFSVMYMSVCFIHLKLELSKRPASHENNFKYPVRKIDKCVLFNEVNARYGFAEDCVLICYFFCLRELGSQISQYHLERFSFPARTTNI